MPVRHIMVSFRPTGAFSRAFKSALGIAVQNRSKVTVVNAIRYPLGLGLDPAIAIDMLADIHGAMQFEDAVPQLMSQAASAGVELECTTLDFGLSPAGSLVRFANENSVDLMLVGAEKGIGRLTGLHESVDDITDLNPPCSVVAIG